MIESILHIYIISWMWGALKLHMHETDDGIEIIYTTSVIVGSPLWVVTGLFIDAYNWLQEHREGIDLW